jgi:AcrR family transcriptional regulator
VTATRKLVDGDKVDARERLLDATAELLTSRDTLDFSLAELAKVAGLNHGLVQYYFGSKEGLLLALLRRDAEDALDAMRKLVALDISPLNKIELHIGGVVRTYFRRPYINSLINFLQESKQENAAALAMFFVRPLHELQKQILDEAKAAGEIGEVNPMFFYFITMGACDLIFKGRRMLPFAFDVTEIDSALTQSYSDYLAAFVTHALRAGAGAPA